MQNIVLGIDIGSSSVKVAELAREEGTVMLTECDVVELGLEPSSDAVAKEKVIIETLKKIIRKKNIKSVDTVVVISNQSVFSRFVKLPLVGKTKLKQIIKYEAQQQIPYPMDSVVWDYQIVGTEPTEDMSYAEVLLVAIKSELINQVLAYLDAAQRTVDIIDIASLALYNTLHFNGFLDEKCVASLNIGARTSNLVIVEGNKLWTRTIPIAGDSITSAIKAQLGLTYAEAEKLKLANAYVPEPDSTLTVKSEKEKALNSIVKSTVDKLHTEIIRSIGFYRTQYGGSKISKLILSGGGSDLRGLKAHFESKLNVDVSVLDCFNNILIDEKLLQYDLDSVKHLFGEAVGGALRKTAECPKAINLLPHNIATYNIFANTKNYVIGCVVCILLVFMVTLLANRSVVMNVNAIISENEAIIKQTEAFAQTYTKTAEEVASITQKLDELTDITNQRHLWLDVLKTISSCIPENIWLESIKPQKSKQKTDEDQNLQTSVYRRRRARRRAHMNIQRPSAVADDLPELPDSIVLTGKTAAEEYKSLDQFKESLKESDMFDGDSVEILFAKPPEEGLIEFGIQVDLKK